MFVPVGLLMPVVFRRRKHPCLLTLLTGILLSLLTEAAQYLTRRGLCELDDLLNNTLGCLIGIGLFAAGSRLLRRFGAKDSPNRP